MDEVVSEPACRYGSRVYAATYSPDGGILAYGGGSFESEGFVRCRWPDGHHCVVTNRELDGGFAVSALAFDPGGELLAAATRRGLSGGSLYLFRIEDRPLKFVRTQQLAGAIAMGLGFLDGRLTVLYRVRQGPCIQHLEVPEAAAGSVALHYTACGLARMGSKLVVTAGAELQILEGDQISTAAFQVPLRMAAADVSGTSLVTPSGMHLIWWDVSDEGIALAKMIQIDETRTFNKLQTRLMGDGRILEAACFVGDTQTVAAVNRAGYVSLWERGEPRGCWWLPDGTPRCIACDPTRRHLAIGAKGTQHPEASAARMLSYDPPIQPETQSVAEGRLFIYEV